MIKKFGEYGSADPSKIPASVLTRDEAKEASARREEELIKKFGPYGT